MAEVPRIAQLIVNHFAGMLTPSEKEELETWMNADPENRLYMETRAHPEVVAETLLALSKMDEEILDKKAWDRIDRLTSKMRQKTRFIQASRRVAATVIFLLITPLFGRSDFLPCRNPLLRNQSKHLSEPAQRPMLTTSTEKQLFLDTLVNGRLGWLGNCLIVKRRQDNIALVSMNKKIVAEATPDSLYITVSVPPCVHMLQISLPDGSQVYMEGGSSLTYCLHSSGVKARQRIAALDGQASFDVAHDSLLFVLETSKAEMLVYGTSFFVRDFHQEDTVSIYQFTDELELNNGRRHRMLFPSQQATLDHRNIKIVKTVAPRKNPEFRREVFDFSHKTLRGALKEIATWYGIPGVHVDASLGADTAGPLSQGHISKDLSLNSLMDLLQSDKMHFHANEFMITATR